MAQQGPLTSAAQNFFSAFNAAQTRQRQEELIQLKRQEKQEIINAAELKRQQELDDREAAALATEGAIGVDISGAGEPGEPGEKRGRGRVDGFVFATDRSRKKFAEAVAINPSLAAPILNFLSKSSDFQLEQKARQTDRRFRGWRFLQEQNKKGPLQLQEGIKQLVESGLYSEKESEKLVQLSGQQNPDLVNLTIEKGISDTEPEKILIDDELAKRKEGRAVQTRSTKLAKIRGDLENKFITTEEANKSIEAELKNLTKGDVGLFSAKSKIFPNGTTVLISPDGKSTVKDRAGNPVAGDKRIEVLDAAQQSEIDVAGAKKQAQVSGGESAKASSKFFGQLPELNKNILNIEDAIQALDDGARTGVVASRLTSIDEASKRLEDVQNQLGLDVLGATSFGNLSDAERAFALRSALPLNFDEATLKTWLANKKRVMREKIRVATEAAIFLGKPGNTISKFVEQQEKLKGVTPQPQTPAKRTFTIRRKQ